MTSAKRGPSRTQPTTARRPPERRRKPRLHREVRRTEFRDRPEHGTVNVPIHGDKVTEPNETFTLDLDQANSTATIGDGSGTGTILNDDANPTVKIGDSSVAEGNSGTKPMVFHVTLNHASASPITVHYRYG